uniref:class F sortase n=1 Tax=Citricoccus sp. TaxID=1978372 RepID=UPI0028BF1CA4
APPSAETAGDATPLGVPSSPAAATPTADPSPVTLGEGVAPARLRVPSIEVEEDLIGLGLQENGAMEVPADWDRAGWFTGGGKPGGPGPTVIAGHVDSPTAPAVFFRLTELEVGDAIEVTDAEGTVHEYAVYRVDDLPKDRFPTAEVFGALATDELRLITCTGEFDQSTLTHADNRVVFASPADTLAGD